MSLKDGQCCWDARVVVGVGGVVHCVIDARRTARDGRFVESRAWHSHHPVFDFYIGGGRVRTKGICGGGTMSILVVRLLSTYPARESDPTSRYGKRRTDLRSGKRIRHRQLANHDQCLCRLHFVWQRRRKRKKEKEKKKRRRQMKREQRLGRAGIRRHQPFPHSGENIECGTRSSFVIRRLSWLVLDVDLDLDEVTV